MVDDERRGCCRCSTGIGTSVRRGGRTRSGAASRHGAWYWGKVLTLLIGASEAKAPDVIGREPELHSSALQLEDESDVELDT